MNSIFLKGIDAASLAYQLASFGVVLIEDDELINDGCPDCQHSNEGGCYDCYSGCVGGCITHCDGGCGSDCSGFDFYSPW